MFIGSLVRMAEGCRCRDPRGCYHHQCIVRHIFKDGSAWIHNRHGYARRLDVNQIQIARKNR